MIQWSETDLLIRDGIKEFIDKEIRPHVDELEHGDLPPYEIIRKMFSTFGIDEMARESFRKQIAREKAKSTALAAGEEPPATTKAGGGSQLPISMALLVFSEICKVSMGVSSAAGVSLIEECQRLSIEYAKSRILWGQADWRIPADPVEAGQNGDRADQCAEHGVPCHRVLE
jgi:alkylation response protein AidB-like acyl-CoA dehydrogenase